MKYLFHIKFKNKKSDEGNSSFLTLPNGSVEVIALTAIIVVIEHDGLE